MRGISGMKTWQAAGQLQSKWPLPVLKALLSQQNTPPDSNIRLGELGFETLAQSYTLAVRAQQWPLWDHFQIRLNSPHPQQIKLSLQDNWFPSGQILDRLQTSIEERVSPLKLRISRQQNSLLIQWPLQNLSLIPRPELNLNLSQLMLKTQIYTDGTLKLDIHTVHNAQNTPKSMNTEISTLAQGEVNTCLGSNLKLQGSLSFNSQLEILPSDLAQIQLGQETLSDRFQASGKIEVALKSQFKGQLLPFKLQAKGQNRSKHARISGRRAALSQLAFSAFSLELPKSL
jgi:hypothetical protein